MKKRALSMTAVGLAAAMMLTGAAGTSVWAEDTAEEGNYVDIVFWDNGTEGDASNVLYQEFADSFGEEHGITVERTALKTQDLNTTIRPAINSGEGPDVFVYEIGSGYLGVLAKGGLAYDMTEYADANGWHDHFMDNALSSTTYDGKIYGVGNELEALGVYYNKAIFSEYGLEEPTTYEEFEQICQTLKDNGVTPIMLDDLEQWPGYHYESMWTNAFAGCDVINDVLALKGGFNQDGLAQGMDKLYEIVSNGWTIDSPNAMAHDDARRYFLTGEAAMYPTGTWEVSPFGSDEEGIGEDCGFFFLPAPEGMETSGVFGLGSSVVVNAKSDPDKIFTALKFIDYMFDQENLAKWCELGYMPAVKTLELESYDVPALFSDWADAALHSPKQGNNLDVLMPAKVNEATGNYVQELLAGKKTGMECMEAKQAALDEEVADGNYEAIVK